jgi:superfamily II DNA/RNA helicase
MIDEFEGWKQFNLAPGILSSIKGLGWKTPTPIQTESLPYSMKGRDIIGIAQVSFLLFSN